MSIPYDLSRMSPAAFEHLVNYLILKVLGPGGTGFGPGADGGRDGYFEGKAPYPSTTSAWSGIWYIQSKFHAPHLTLDSQKWLAGQVTAELKLFQQPHKNRTLPNNFIVATNIEPSGVALTGTFDKLKAQVDAVAKSRNTKINFDIWGGQKILNFLNQYPDAAELYGHYLTPGHVLTEMYHQMNDQAADLKTVVEYLVVNQFTEQQFMKLDQAGSAADSRPGIEELFIDLPFSVDGDDSESLILNQVALAASQNQKHSLRKNYPDTWSKWSTQPKRARNIIIKGGPGQGKSTIGQYLSQIQRAALLLGGEGLSINDKTAQRASDIKRIAEEHGVWPAYPRIPIWLELKEFAQWYGAQNSGQSLNVLSFVAAKIQTRVGQAVLEGMLKRSLALRSWLVVFDGLDEVPNDVKDLIASQITYFVNEVSISVDSDVLVVCTSRPQGYSGQFDALDGPIVVLSKLDIDTALRCAAPVVGLDRTALEAEGSMQILRSAAESESVQELMTTPLQAHIMAVVVRDGGRPPERRWQLFENFYQVMKKRESLKNFPNQRIAKLLREDDKLLKSVHCRLGFVLHARAETSDGAQTNMNRDEFRGLVREAVSQLEDEKIEETVDLLMEATTERLVLVSTPENGSSVQFDIRQLQEFFAAEFLYRNVDSTELQARITTVCGDAHWREVMHFLLSALFEAGRTTEIAVAINALDQLNQREDSTGSSAFSKRMARGALLAARLLCEGVLEQDKRPRSQLRSVFQPIVSISDTSKLLQLQELNPPSSRAWFIEYLLQSLEESNSYESIGAMSILGRLLPDTHPKNVELIDYFCRCPTGVIAITLESLNHRFSEYFEEGGSAPPAAPWVVRAVIQLIKSGRLGELSFPGVFSAFQILRNDPTSTLNAAVVEELTSGELLILDALTRRERPRQNSKNDAIYVDYGIIKAEYGKYDWTTRTEPKHRKIAKAIGSLDSTRGLFEFFRNCFAFVDSGSPSMLYRAIDMIGADRMYLFASFPDSWRAYFPIDMATNCLLLAFVKDQSEFPQVPMSTGARSANSFRLAHDEPTQAQWEQLLRDYPHVAARIWFGLEQAEISSPKVAQTAHGAEQILAVLEASPELAVSLILGWGKIIDLNPALRSRLIAISSIEPRPTSADSYWNGVHYPFAILTVEELPVLRHIASAIVSIAAESKGPPHMFRRSREMAKNWIGEAYCVDTIVIDGLLKSEPSNKQLREYALVWKLLTLSFNKQPDEEQRYLYSVIDEVLDVDCNLWILRIITFWLERTKSELNPQAVVLIGRLSNYCRESQFGREQVQNLLGVWREKSMAPVHAAQVMTGWLTYTYA